MKNNYNHTINNIISFLCFVIKNRSFSIHEAIIYLEKENIFVEKETVLKYIRTLKKVGFEFIKPDNKTYLLTDTPFKIEYTGRDNDIFIKIIETINTFSSNKYESLVKKFLEFIPEKENFYLLKRNYAQNDNNGLYALYERYCTEKQQLQIRLNNEQILFEPNEIIYDKGILILKGYNVTKKQISLINIDEINSIKQLPTKIGFDFIKKEAILSFSSRIAKIYALKEGEKVLKKTPTNLIVKTQYDDEESFYKRILKYMETCTIIYPEPLAKRFLTYIKELYQMYDCS